MQSRNYVGLSNFTAIFLLQLHMLHNQLLINVLLILACLFFCNYLLICIIINKLISVSWIYCKNIKCWNLSGTSSFPVTSKKDKYEMYLLIKV